MAEAISSKFFFLVFFMAFHKKKYKYCPCLQVQSTAETESAAGRTREGSQDRAGQNAAAK